MEFLSVAMIQMKVVADDFAANFSRADHLIGEALAQKPAHFALLPECMDIGWGNPKARQLAEPIPGKYFQELARIAKKHNVWLVAGLTEKDGEHTYNSAVMISQEGQLVSKHRKINVCFDVTDVYDIGNTLCAPDTPFGRIGMDICADNFLSNLAIGHTLARMGAQVILSPTSWAVPGDHDNNKTPYGADWTVPYGELSRLYDISIAGVSNVGPVTCGQRTGWSSIGNSMAYGPGGEPVLILPFGEDAECTAVVDLPLLPSSAKGDLTPDYLALRGYRGI